MWGEWMWAGGRVRTGAALGVPAGLSFGLINIATTGHAIEGLVAGIYFALVFGAVMAVIMWRQWPGARALAPDDRVAVVRAVHRGEAVGEERLAGAVLDYAAVVTRTQEREERLRWVLFLFGLGALLVAVTSTLSGSAREAVVDWLLVAFWLVALTRWFPSWRKRLLDNARRAETLARLAAGPAPPAGGSGPVVPGGG